MEESEDEGSNDPAKIAKQLFRSGTITEDEYNQIVNRDKLFRGRVDSLNAYREEAKKKQEDEEQEESVIAAHRNAEQLYKDGLINQEDFKRLSQHALMFSRQKAGENVAKRIQEQQQQQSPSQRIRGWFNKLRSSSPASVVVGKSAKETVSEKLASACRDHNLEEIHKILSEHPEAVDMSSSHDFKTPLHIAAASGHFETVRTLIKYGASLRKLDAKGHSAVDSARTRKISSFLSTRCFDQQGSSVKPRSKMIRRSSSFFEVTGRLFDYFCVCTFRVGVASSNSVRVLERVPKKDHIDTPLKHLSISNIGAFLPCGGRRSDPDMADEWWSSETLYHTFALTLREPQRVVYVTALCFSSLSKKNEDDKKKCEAAYYNEVGNVCGFRDERVFLLFSHYPLVNLSKNLLRKAYQVYKSSKHVSYKDLADNMESLMTCHVPKRGEKLKINLESPFNICINVSRGNGSSICVVDGGDDMSGIGVPLSSSTTRTSTPTTTTTSTSKGAFLTLFECLSPTDVGKILGALLQEKNVIIVSQYTNLLTPCCEALLALLFPLKWSGVYVPNLPLTLIQMCDTPVPFLIGMHLNNMSHITRFCNPGQTYVPNYVEVNLDTKTCVFTKETGIPIPKPLIVQFASRVACSFLIEDPNSRRDDVFLNFSSALRNFYDAHNPDRLRREASFLPRAVALYHKHQSFLFRELSGRYKVLGQKVLKQKNTLRRYTNEFCGKARRKDEKFDDTPSSSSSLKWAPNGRFMVRAAGLELLYSLIGGFQVVRMIPEVAVAICVEQRKPKIVGEQFRELEMTLNGLHTNAISVAEAASKCQGEQFQRKVLETQMYKMYAAEYTRLVQVSKPRADEIVLFDRYADGRNEGTSWIDMAAKTIGDSSFVSSLCCLGGSTVV